MSSPPHHDAAEAAALLRALTRTLAGVAVLAAVFTAVNVTGFATAHRIPWPIAILLDPMAALALAAVLLADARLASWGLRPPAWSAALRWFTGTTATVMNTWTSIWPDNRIGWPHHADPAGVLLHTVPPVLLILLTETVAAYRQRITALQTGTRDHPLPDSPPAGCTVPPGAPPAIQPAPADSASGGPHPPGSSPLTAPAVPIGPGVPGDAVSGEVFTRALRLDAEHRSRTGGTMSIRQLKIALRIGHARAKALRIQLDAHHSGTAPRTAPAPAAAPREHPAESSQTPLHQGR